MPRLSSTITSDNPSNIVQLLTKPASEMTDDEIRENLVLLRKNRTIAAARPRKERKASQSGGGQRKAVEDDL